MSYLVLARKHRPSTFEQVVGQEHITKTLAGALASGRLAHAFCFTGPRGVGKTSVARILAKAVNCEQGPTDQPCGQCNACREIDEGRAVDVQEIDAASNSRVEDVRELREMIRYRPQSARFRVTILDEVHMLSKAAFNALLKTLEEPPEHAIFILATTDVHKVPLTILSRCQRYDFRRLPPRLLAEHLAQVLEKEGTSLEPASLALMAREADGSVRDALSLLDQVLSLGRQQMSHQEVVELLGLVDREMVRQTAQAVLAGDAGRVLDLVAQVYAAGGEMQAYYGALQEHFRNLAAAKAAPAGSQLFGLTAEELKELRAQAQEVSAETLHEIFDQLARAEELFRRASQPRLVMEMTLLKLTQVKPVLSLEQILEALARGGGLPTQAPSPRPAAPAAPASPAAPAAPAAPVASSPGPVPPAAGAPAGCGLPESAQEVLVELANYAGRAGEPILCSALGRARARWEQNALVVELPPGPTAELLCGDDSQEKLAGFLGELYGFQGGVRLEVGAEPKAGRERPAAAAGETRGRLRELADHPVVQEALEVFEAQVVAVNPENGAK